MRPSRSLPGRGERSQRLHLHKDDLRLSIPSVFSAIERVCAQIRSLLEERHLEGMRFAVEVAARECLNNAILHGNRGEAGRRVRFAMRVGRRLICLRIGDQGTGFNWRVRRRAWPEDLTAGGRGLMVAGLYAQRVAFNRRGNEVTVWINTVREGR
jgi:serine/threonine-protein kinase RsbW